MQRYLIDFAEIDWESPIAGMRQKAFRDGGKQIRLVEYTREMEPHWCEKGHYGYLLEGDFEIEYESEKAVYRPGDGIFIPSGPEHRHKGITLTDTVRVIFVEDI